MLRTENFSNAFLNIFQKQDLLQTVAHFNLKELRHDILSRFL